MRILYITQAFPPEPGPTIRPLRQAVELQRLGHRVTILTTMPSAPLGVVWAEYRRRLVVRERLEGVDVVRVVSLASPNRGYARRALSWGSFAGAAALAGLAMPAHSTVMASVPHLGTELAGLVVARLRGGRFVLEVRDLLPDNLQLVGIESTSRLARVLRTYFAWVYARADIVVVAGRGMARCLEERGVPPSKILVLPHATDPLPEGPAPVLVGGEAGALRALFCGSFSRYYALPTLVAAGRALEAADAHVQIFLMGTGRERHAIEQDLRARPCSRITLLPAVPPAEAPRWLQAADVLLAPCVFDAPVPHLVDYLTTKSAQSFGAGRALLAIEDQPVLRNVLAETGAGRTLPGGDPGAIAEALVAWAGDRRAVQAAGERARAYAEAHLQRDQVVAQFGEELARLLHGASTSSAPTAHAAAAVP